MTYILVILMFLKEASPLELLIIRNCYLPYCDKNLSR